MRNNDHDHPSPWFKLSFLLFWMVMTQDMNHDPHFSFPQSCFLPNKDHTTWNILFWLIKKIPCVGLEQFWILPCTSWMKVVWHLVTILVECPVDSLSYSEMKWQYASKDVGCCWSQSSAHAITEFCASGKEHRRWRRTPKCFHTTKLLFIAARSASLHHAMQHLRSNSR